MSFYLRQNETNGAVLLATDDVPDNGTTWNMEQFVFFYSFSLFDPVHSLSAAFVLKLPLADTVKSRD